MKERFAILDTPLEGLKVIRRKPQTDERGYFERLFCADELRTLMGTKGIAQINHSFTSKRGTVHGMHFQHPPHAEVKFVSCLSGEVFDVAVDLRRDSPTFLHSYAEVLSSANYKTLVIPEGFAHGYQALVDDSQIVYVVSVGYTPSAEGGIHPEDPLLRIAWPLPVTGLSQRDLTRPYLDSNFTGVRLFQLDENALSRSRSTA
ncbi:MAG: dTDP-4-dehydrorhamnose 3,5-epimerase family protein [Gemmatimonadota bacterium]|nr:dTDP-4-dehydrorhamnose 3,5-epimerase family protein [Gemmatimonadota bacterium]